MLIKAVAQAAVEKGCARLQWQVIDFNTAGPAVGETAILPQPPSH